MCVIRLSGHLLEPHRCDLMNKQWKRSSNLSNVLVGQPGAVGWPNLKHMNHHGGLLETKYVYDEEIRPVFSN